MTETEDSVELDTPLLLLAMPQVLDPFFHQSVILLLRHEEEGSLGFIVNRPTELRIAEIMEGLELPWHEEDGSTAYFGGPVQPQLGTLIHLAKVDASQEQVYPGVSCSQQLADLEELADAPAGTFRLFLGYAGWDEGQLAREILRNDWLTAPVRKELLFGDRPKLVWHDALKSVGIDPAQLPSWTPGSSGSNVEPVAN